MAVYSKKDKPMCCDWYKGIIAHVLGAFLYNDVRFLVTGYIGHEFEFNGYAPGLYTGGCMNIHPLSLYRYLCRRCGATLVRSTSLSAPQEGVDEPSV
jgi:hypothetical protein